MEKFRIHVKIAFLNKTDEQMNHIYKAEMHLLEVGVLFDIGGWEGIGHRDWDLDWSLKGAIVLTSSKANAVIRDTWKS